MPALGYSPSSRSCPRSPGERSNAACWPVDPGGPRFYVPLALSVGFALPAGLAWTWGDPWGGLLAAGFLRISVQYEATFSINSVAHSFGRQPYATDTSARDSAIAAVVTLGEGYHNYHHRFPADYRNGVRWYHFDPTKWWIWALSRIGLAWDLKRAPREAIQAARERLRPTTAVRP